MGFVDSFSEKTKSPATPEGCAGCGASGRELVQFRIGYPHPGLIRRRPITPNPSSPSAIIDTSAGTTDVAREMLVGISVSESYPSGCIA